MQNTAAHGGESPALHLEPHRDSLVNLYYQILRETLFNSRSELRPAVLKQIAAEEADFLIDFFNNPTADAGIERGVHLCERGVGDQAALKLGQAARQFIVAHLPGHQPSAALDIVDLYHHAFIQGFLKCRERIILSEQERIRGALQRTLSRYTVQMEVAAGVASATTSILDLDTLLHTAVELIRERFDLYYVGLFLTDEHNRWAILRAGTGKAGQEMLAQGYVLDVDGDSMIGLCIARDEAGVALDVGREPARFENPLLPDTHSEVAIPLRSHGRVIGALNVHSQHVGAFTDLDVTVFRILADQLANGIANARLFAELRRSEEKYRTILENMEEGYYETAPNGVFTFVNDATSQILGRHKSEIIGANYLQFVDPEYVDKIAQAFVAVSRTGKADRGVEYRIVGPGTAARLVDISISLIRDAAGQPAGLRGIIRDITSRKQAERLLIERKALERSNKELEQFAYVASHDMQEPLRKIQAFGDRLKIKNGPALNDEGRDYLERMLSAASRMQNLINDLLALSRVATKGQPFVPVALPQVASEVVSDLETLIEETRGRVEVGDLPTIEADPLQMRQLLQNLIGNGLKFHRAEESPVIKVYQLFDADSDPLDHENTRSQIFVEDNGIGFDEKYLERIFQPFQRLHGRNEYQGTGIGLTICQRIVERHGGSITARSQPGRGTTFIITLPVHQKKGDTWHENW